MSRVLITGGASPLGASVARLLLADPAYDVRISDERQAPRWMREGCEVHRGDLRSPAQASAAVMGCSHVIHLACFAPDAGPALAPNAEEAVGDGASANGSGPAVEPGGPRTDAVEGTIARGDTDAPHSLLAYEDALHVAVVGAAVERGVERFLYVSTPLVFERAELFPTPEEHLEECLTPRSAGGFARLSGERLCEAASREHGLRYTICRPFGAYGPASTSGGEPATGAGTGPVGRALALNELIERAAAGDDPLAIAGTGEQTLAPTHVEDLAAGIVAAMSAPAAADEDFNLGAARELSLEEIAKIAWRAGAEAADASQPRRAEGPSLKRLPAGEFDVARSFPATAKARELLGWEARIDALEGIAAVAAQARRRAVSVTGGTFSGD